MRKFAQNQKEYAPHMSKIGMTGSLSFTNQLAISSIFQSIKRQYGTYAEIFTGGNDTGADLLIKKLALELGFPFKEFNPSFTGFKMYSAMPESYYGKGYHYSHLMDRYKQLVNCCEYLIIFIEKGIDVSPDLKYAIQRAQKLKKKIVVIHK